MLININDLIFHKSVHGIIHIGAHECEERCQYLIKFHNITDNEIIWIDALKDKVDCVKTSFPSVKIFNECISDKDNECVTFKVTNNYQSSSILNLKEHLIEHPDIYEINKIEMKTKTLKTFYKENNFAYNQFNFMALDIQGAELLALKGAQEILNFVDYLYLEVNTKEIYENCALLEDIEKYLEKFGFKRQNILMTGHGWGDAFYAKNIFTIENNFRIEYGTDIIKIDVTEKTLQNEDKIITIPQGDNERGKIFGDPVYGTLKQVYLVDDENIYTIQHTDYAFIDSKNSKLYINRPLPQKDFLNIMAIFKNETMNLKLWLDHYLWQGAEHFYLIDNGSTDNPLEILQNYIDQGIVTYYFKPEKYCQVEHYRHVYDAENIKEKTCWLCICDLDEFFFGTEKKLTSTLLESFDNFDVICTNSYFYGSDNLIEHPKDIRTSIIHRQEDMENGIKYLFKPKAIVDSSEIWIHWLVDSGTTYKKVLDREIFENKKIRLNHYNIQSLEFYQKVKMARGDVNLSHNDYARTMDCFNHYQKLSTIKDDILKQLVEKHNDESIVENFTLCNYLENNMPRDKYNFFLKSFEGDTFCEEDNFLYKFDNVISYEYKMFIPEVKISKINKPVLTNPTLYFIFDGNGLDSFGHWIYESFIWFPILEKLNTMNKDVKILTSNKKKYVKKFLNFFGLTNEVVYTIEDKNNICFIPPPISLNAQVDTPIFVRLVENFAKRIEITALDLKILNKILFLPRNTKDNYWPTDKIDVKFLFERRIQSDVDIISEGVIRNGGIVLNSYEINNSFVDFSLIKSSRNIIIDYGSAHFVNCVACKNKNIVIVNRQNTKHHDEFTTSLRPLQDIIEKNNNVTIITEFSCFEDIEKYLVY